MTSALHVLCVCAPAACLKFLFSLMLLDQTRVHSARMVLAGWGDEGDGDCHLNTRETPTVKQTALFSLMRYEYK